MKKRNLFAELTEGLDALAAEHEGKITLRKITAAVPDALEISPAEIKAVREASHASQAVMARSLRINVRTYQNWEQGKAKPNAQAATLIRLVAKHPETLQMLATL
ncbi:MULTISPECIES: helix-turn-helix domain-containing protein [Burkholderia]|uniref:helix-turn-helix domain-containing protein n=1 Tax=Burkholderia TaxID=32008 RepID=UPI000BBD022A|nr:MULTISPECIES: helix-turn-helix domain-containing protein [Burkholderia]ATF85227.1 transcriptional regulator [Burkholderia gladioli pv. gladioli]MBJ9710811.1 transcriptional regulator [Burkholderia gladioli]MBU9155511.1 transcriptional regulator [Burkholderia gladioli]MBU9167960.1 transcriptional regulator [Burkholderia gladioli]MBU9379454.1 transcriptional regulator [Burkholderia gladioli]